jgi:Domain of unknown function (DUF4062)
VAEGDGRSGDVIRTPDQRVRVFVSSTLEELAAERRAVTTAIRQLRLTPVLFELGARPYAPRDLYRAYLKQSDVFVGIYAESYGWVAPGMDVSGLEDEYRLSADKPRLIYRAGWRRQDLPGSGGRGRHRGPVRGRRRRRHVGPGPAVAELRPGEAQAASPAAAALLTEALRTWQQLRLRAGVAFALAGLGEVAADGGQPDRAGQLLGAAQALLPATRNPLLRVTVPYDLPARLAAARARGDPAAFDRGLAEAQDWTIDQAVAAGLANADRP